jgi:serine/threonine protein kinase
MQKIENLVGSSIDDYEITELLGKGGMGVVYKARDIKLERDVALKIMDPLLAREEAFLKRFWSEAKALAKLQSPYIVAIYAMRETDFGICIVMEYVKGMTLADVLKSSGALPVDRTMNMFKQLLMAFEHAHSVGIIHRDVKPGNILITDANIAKVMDFGLAKIYQPSAATLTSISGGTLFYASPEQLEGLGKVDHRGDIYSLGMTMYETLTGAVPFGNKESDFAIRESIVKGKIPPPRSLKPDIPGELNAIVMKAIAREPEKRFQSAGEMRAALEDYEESVKIEKRLHVKGIWQRIKPALVPVLAVVILALVGFILYPLFFGTEASLTVRSIPVGAKVEVNGQAVGETPLRGLAVAGGKVHVRLSCPNYMTKDTTIDMSRGESLILSVQLNDARQIASRDTSVGTTQRVQQKELTSSSEKTTQKIAETRTEKVHEKPKLRIAERSEGQIIFALNPGGASVWIDGSRVQGATQKVSAGSHALRVTSGANVWEKRVTVSAGGKMDIAVDFTRKIRVTVVAVDMEGQPIRGAKVLVDGAAQDLPTPVELSLLFGLHTIRVHLDGYRDPTPVVRNFEQDMVFPNPLKFVLKKTD